MKHITEPVISRHQILIKSISAFILSVSPVGVFASAFSNAATQVGNLSASAGMSSNRSLIAILGSVIGITFSFLGILLLGYMLYAGFLWMTSGGNDEKAEKARTMIKNAVIGLVIIASAFAISEFVLTYVGTAVTGQDPGPTQRVSSPNGSYTLD